MDGFTGLLSALKYFNNLFRFQLLQKLQNTLGALTFLLSTQTLLPNTVSHFVSKKKVVKYRSIKRKAKLPRKKSC